MNDPRTNQILANEWKVFDVVGFGKYCAVYSVMGLNYGPAAAKLNTANQFSLQNEYSLMLQLQQNWKNNHRNSISEYPMTRAVQLERYERRDLLVMKPLGGAIRKLTGRDCKVKYITAYRTAILIINALENMHQIGHVHLDVNPANIIAGVYPQDVHMVFLSDVGSASKFLGQNGNWVSNGRSSVPQVDPVYAARITMDGGTSGPREDLESLGYTLVSLIKGTSLPWYMDNHENMQKYKDTSYRSHLCIGLPVMKLYFSIIDNLAWGEWPDYAKIRNIFESAISNLCPDESLHAIQNDSLDWNKPRNSQEGYNCFC